MPSPRRHAAPFDTPIDIAMLRRVVRAISSVGSHPLGFRAAGTPEEHEVAELVAGEMRGIGLDVHLERVPVHAWRLRRATVSAPGLRAEIEGASMAGVPGTTSRGVRGEMVFVGDGRRDRLDRLDLRGRIALVAWGRSAPWINETGLELALRGARAIVVCCLDDGPRFTGKGALGTSVSGWYDGAPPLVTVRAKDGRALTRLCRTGPVEARVTLAVEARRRAAGRNVCGVLGAGLRGAPLVVGAHHDGWFFGAFDNASGVATMLAIAKGLQQAGWRPRRPVWFVSHTAEEYGRVDDDQPWCVGGWHQVAVEHPRWGASVPFYLDIEASGRPEFPQVVLAPPELSRFARGWGRRAERAGLIRRGWKVERPSTGTHQWPFQLAGVPGLSVLNWHERFSRTDYHTDLDTAGRMDFAHLAGQAAFYAAMVADAEARGGDILDHRAREREIARLPGGDALADAAAAYRAAGSRRAFTRVVRRGIAVDAAGEVGYLPAQAAKDASALAAAIGALERDDRAAAARECRKVGVNHLQRWVSEEVQRRSERRHVSSRGSWPAASHLTRTPDLWQEIAALRGERGARRYGPWVLASLRRHHARCEAEREKRTAALAAALRG